MPLPLRYPFVVSACASRFDASPGLRTLSGDFAMLDHDCGGLLPSANAQLAIVMIWIYT
jgi:hypothetical protein